ncbi:uncharacterized protein LOC131852583 [Achroia grisella]|uniref:uncharacterized protein LOC131852583 n=1 Tax=Achroia grisella TaxID=688607 RepID=UPI0027D27935|nr:uncharacterized protein LOC131852583 [Achroia grisella]
MKHSMTLVCCQLTDLVVSLPVNFGELFPNNFLGVTNFKNIVPHIELKIPTSVIEISRPFDNFKDIKISNPLKWQPDISSENRYRNSDTITTDNEPRRENFEQDNNEFGNDEMDNFVTSSTNLYETTTDSTTDGNWTTTDEDLFNRIGGAAVASLLG